MHRILTSPAARFLPEQRVGRMPFWFSVTVPTKQADVYDLLGPCPNIYAAFVLIKYLKASPNLSDYAECPDYGMIFHLHDSTC